MKRFLAILLVLSMLACMLPAFSFAAEEEEDISGLNAKVYQLNTLATAQPFDNDWRYHNIIGTSTNEYEYCGYDDTQRFASSIDQLMLTSKVYSTASDLTSFTPPLAKDAYITKWEGTITAKEAATYYLVARQIDNGFAMYVDQNGNGTFEDNELFFDYWAINHWFDGQGEHTLVTNKGGFALAADQATAVQIWYYEAGGGEALEINVSKNSDGADNVSFADAGLSLALDQTIYITNLAVNHNRIHGISTFPIGVKPDGTAANETGDALANMEGNHNYDQSIEGILSNMLLLGEVVLPNYETAGMGSTGDLAGSLSYLGFRYEDSMIDYTGYVTPAVSGDYQFGTAKVDNCLMVEIEIDGVWTRVYELWGRNMWNTKTVTYSDTVVKLEAGTSYKIHVAYLEINGGNAVESRIKVNGEEQSMASSGLAFSTKPMEKAPEITTVNFFQSGSDWKYMTSGEGNTVTEAPAGWNTDAAVSADWATGTAPLSDEWNTADNPVNNKYIWATKTFDVEDADAFADWALMATLRYDDNIHIYINGKCVFVDGGWNGGYETYKLGIDAADFLVDGTNLVAVSLVQGHGGFEFDGGVYATKDDTSAYLPNYYEIATADELLALVATFNELNKTNDAVTRGKTVVLTADIDMSGKAWTPLGRFIGTFDGQGHTISNLSYTATGSIANTGMFITDVTNNNANGRVQNIVFDNCVLTVNADNDNAYAGLVAAKADRGNLTNITVKNSKVLGNAMVAAGIAAEICWGITDGHVINCSVENTYIEATAKAAGLVGRATSSDDTVVSGGKVTDVTFKANSVYDFVAETAEKTKINECTISGKTILSELSAPTEGDYAFYYQTRAGVDGTTDYRIICVANTDWVMAQSAINVKLSFTDGTTEKSITEAASTVYTTVTATGDGYTDIYTAAEGTVVFGWVVTGVPAEYAANTPSAVVVD
ncbi:MAG: hypothetical protein IJW46_05215 [Clostridia bacterium]|nr:hypothetical protein [Clostridia bacterium]